MSVTQVYFGHLVAPEGVHETLGHVIALRAADGRINGLEAQRTRQCRDVGIAVVVQELQLSWPAGTASTVPKRRSTASMSISRTGSLGSPFFPISPSHDLTVAIVLREGGGHGLARVVLDF